MSDQPDQPRTNAHIVETENNRVSVSPSGDPSCPALLRFDWATGWRFERLTAEEARQLAWALLNIADSPVRGCAFCGARAEDVAVFGKAPHGRVRICDRCVADFATDLAVPDPETTEVSHGVPADAAAALPDQAAA